MAGHLKKSFEAAQYRDDKKEVAALLEDYERIAQKAEARAKKTEEQKK